MVLRLQLKVKSLKINSRRKKKRSGGEKVYIRPKFISLSWNRIFFFTSVCYLFTSEFAVGGCLTVVMPKSKLNTFRDFFKPHSSEGKEGASSGADTLSATSGWETWL